MPTQALSILALLLILAAMAASVAAKRLTVPGSLTGGLLAFLIYQGAGFTGLAMLAIFFILGSVATSWRLKAKEDVALAEENKGKRNTFQVLANGGFAGLSGLLAWIHPSGGPLYRLMLACSIAASLSDTLASEMGNVYGSRYYNILTFKKDQRGLNGVISVEGSIFGIIGSSIIGIIYGTGFGWSVQVLWIILAGVFGNLFDSILGATLERNGLLGNDAVNFLNNLASALCGLFLFYAFH